MNRRALLSTVTALLMVIMLLASGPLCIAAPITWCGTNCYTVDLTQLAPFPNCHPCITTSWGGGSVLWPPAGQPCYAPGAIVVECPATILPVGTPLDWVNVCGVRLPAMTGQYSVPTACPGCPPLCVRLCTDASGCLYIKVYPGSCTGVLPCP